METISLHDNLDMTNKQLRIQPYKPYSKLNFLSPLLLLYLGFSKMIDVLLLNNIIF